MPRRCSTSWEHRMRCSKCGTEGIPGKKFCAECGNPLSNRCSKCHSDNAPGAKFCADCGSALGTDVVAEGGKPSAAQAAGGVRIAPERQTSEAIEGERKTVTALFADIKGSTELMRDLDPEEASAIVDPALKLMIDAAHRYDGYVVQSTGDGIFALFGAPVAHEDHPQRALHAALAIQQQLRDYAQADHRLKPVPLAEHGRSGPAHGPYGRAHRIHPGWSCGQPRGADANRGAGGWHRNQRGNTSSGRGLLRTARPRED